MGAEQIALLIKWGPLALVATVFVFYFIKGLIKGTYKTLRRLSYVLLFVFLSWFFIKDITTFVLDFDIPINDMGSVRGMITDFIESNEGINKFLEYSPELKSLIIDNPEIIASPFLFLVLLLVVLPLSFPIYFIYVIIWNLIAKYVFKRQKYERDDEGEFVRNEKGKKVKIRRNKRRLLGGLISGVQGVFVICTVFLPINFVNRIYNKAKDSAEVENGETLCSSIEFSEINEDICKYIDIYNETIFAKIGGDGSLDKIVSDRLTTVEIDGNKVSLENEISSIAISAVLLNESGLLKLLIDGVSLDNLDLSTVDFEKINGALDSLFSSYTIQKLSEAGVSYVLNEVLKDKLVETLKDDNIVSKLDFEDYKQIRDELKDVINIVKYAVDEEIDKAIFDNKDNVIHIANAVSVEDVENLINKILSVRIISAAMPSLLKVYVEEYGVNVPEKMTSELNNEISNNFGNAIKFVQTLDATSLEDIASGNIVDNLSNLLFENGVLKTDSKESLAALLHEFNSSYLFKDLVPTLANKLLEDKDYKVDARVLKYVTSKEEWLKELSVLEKGFEIYNDFSDSETIYYDKLTTLLNEISGTKVMISMLPFAYNSLLPGVGLDVDSSNFPSIDFGGENEESNKEEFYSTWEEELTILKNIADSVEELQLQSLEDINVDLLNDEDKVDALSSVMGEIYKSEMLKNPFVDFMKDTMNDFVKDFGVEFSKTELLNIDTKNKWHNEFTNINKVLSVDFSDENNITSENLKTVFDAVDSMALFKDKKVTILKYAVENSGFLKEDELAKIEWPDTTDQEEIDDFYDTETGIFLKIVDKKNTLEELADLDLTEDDIDTVELGSLIDDAMDSSILSVIVVDKMVDLFESEDVNIGDDRDYGLGTNENLVSSIKGVSSWKEELDIIKSMLKINGDNFNEENNGVTRVEQMFIDIEENSDLLVNMRANILMKAVNSMNMSEANVTGVNVGKLTANAYAQYDKEVDVIVSVSKNKEIFEKMEEIELANDNLEPIGILLDKVMNSIIFNKYAIDTMVQIFEEQEIRDDRDIGLANDNLAEGIGSIGVKEGTSWVTELNLIQSMLNVSEETFNKETTVGSGVTVIEKMFDDIKHSDLLSNMRANILLKAVSLLEMEEADLSEVSVGTLKANTYAQYDKEVDVIVSVSKEKDIFDTFTGLDIDSVDAESTGKLLDKVMNSKIFSGYTVGQLVNAFKTEQIRDDRDIGEATDKLAEGIGSIGVKEGTSWVKELTTLQNMLKIDGDNFGQVTDGKTRLEQMFDSIENSDLLSNMRANILLKAVSLLEVDGVNKNHTSVGSLKALYAGEEYYQYNREVDVLITFAENEDAVENLKDIDMANIDTDDKDIISTLLDAIKLSDIFKDKYIEILDGKEGESEKGVLSVLRTNGDLNDYDVRVKTKSQTNGYRTIDWKLELDNLDSIDALKTYDADTVNKDTDEDTVKEIAKTIGAILDAIHRSTLFEDTSGNPADQVVANKLISQITGGYVEEATKLNGSWTDTFEYAMNVYISVLNGFSF